MISKKTIYGSFIYTLVGSLPFASALVLLPFYSNFLSTNDFGALTVYISFSLLVQILATFSIEQYIATHLHQLRDDASERRQKMGSALTLCFLFGLLVIGLFSLIGPSVFKLFDKDSQLDFWTFGMMSVVTGMFNGYFRNYTTLLIYDRQEKEYIAANLINFFATIGLSIFFLYRFESSLMGPMLGRLTSGVVIFFVALVHHLRNYPFRFQMPNAKEILWFAAPMLLISLFNWSIAYIDRFFLTAQISMDQIGVYDFATKFLLPVELMHMGLSNFLMPKIYSSWDKNFTNPPMVAANQMLHSFSILTVLAIIGTIFIIPIAVPLIVKNEDLYLAFSLLPLLSISFLTRSAYNLLSGVLMLQKATTRIVFAFVITGITQFGASYFLIPSFGLEAAMYIAVATKLLLVLVLYFVTSQSATIDLRMRKFFWYPLSIGIGLFVFYQIQQMGFWAVWAAFVLFAAVITWVFFGKELRPLLAFYLGPKAR
jgi:O-antigen/teichoic acid export membrane protein